MPTVPDNAFELLTRVLCDTPPDKETDGAYLYCTTVDNQRSVFQTAATLISHGMVSQVYILEATAMGGYPGVDAFRIRLREFGLTAEQINGVPAGAVTSINTLIESEAWVRFAKAQGLCSLVVVSPPFHQLRAFMTAVTVAIREYPELSVYSCPGEAMPWMDAVVHSQGTLQAPRWQLIQEELRRIHQYQRKGDLARFEDVLAYLNRRDTA